jgi:phage replication-related protein YjqB (UPF0714/DUF867 family)
MDGFKHNPILLNLERLVNGGTFDNLINMIFNSLLVHGGVTEQGVTEQVIVDHCSSVNANFIFEGLRVKPAVNFRKERRGL